MITLELQFSKYISFKELRTYDPLSSQPSCQPIDRIPYIYIKINSSMSDSSTWIACLLLRCVLRKFQAIGQNTRDQISKDMRSKRAWSNCILYISLHSSPESKRMLATHVLRMRNSNMEKGLRAPVCNWINDGGQTHSLCTCIEGVSSYRNSMPP